MNVIILVIFAWVCVAAIYDYKLKKIPDLLTACCWMVIALAGFRHDVYYFGVCVFSGFFLANTISSIIKKPMFGWGDILILPVVFMVAYSYSYLAVGIVLAFIILSCVISIIRKKPISLAPYLSVAMIFFTCAEVL